MHKLLKMHTNIYVLLFVLLCLGASSVIANKTKTCPSDQPPLVSAKTQVIQSCTNASCPEGYVCDVADGFCCSSAKPTSDTEQGKDKLAMISDDAPIDTNIQFCGPDGRPFKDRNGNMRRCERDADCLAPTVCLEGGYCCLLRLDQEPPPIGCPFGTRPLKNANGVERSCSPTGANSRCPGDSLCYQDALDGTYRCCGKDPGEGCPTGSRALKGTDGRKVLCRPGIGGSASSACSGGALCQWSYLIDRYQCCEADNGCPKGSTPLRHASGLVKTCTPNVHNSCSANYDCRFNFWTASYQCCGLETGMTIVGCSCCLTIQ